MRKVCLMRWLAISISFAICFGVTYFYRDVILQQFGQVVSQAEPEVPIAATSPPDLRMLAENTGGHVRPLSPQQQQAWLAIEREQIASAKQWLQDPDPAERLTGAEQLSAYPTPEAEQALIKALKSDLAPEVRAAAALSLDSIETLSDESIKVLLAALNDDQDQVRDNALSTLGNALMKADTESMHYKKLFKSLKVAAKSKKLALATREELTELLANQ